MKKDYLRLPINPGRLDAFLVTALCLAMAGCGSTGARNTSSRTQGAKNGVLGFKTAHTRSRAVLGSKAVFHPGRLFSPTSIWNKPLAPDAPLDPDSAEMIARFDDEVAQEESEKRGPWINTKEYGLPILTVPSDQPTIRVRLDHSPEPALSAAWSAVPLPSDAEPAAGTDADLVVWQPSTDRMWEFWRLSHQSDGWHAVWGGAMRHVSGNPGVYGPDAWPGAKTWWGVSASSLALAGGAMTIEELRRGRIEHALVVSIPEVRAHLFASPAQRTDGRSTNPLALPEGARLRLDPHLNLASVPMPPLVRAMAVAAQRYGVLVSDGAPNVAFIGQDPRPTGSNPYVDPGGLFEGKSPAQLLASFPWSHLQVLKMELHAKK